MRHLVTEADTAAALGSGDVPVLATPRLLAWLEAATVRALTDLPVGTTSVGTRIELEHLRPSELGASVWCQATVAEQHDRSVTLTVHATDEAGHQIARGTVVRALVDRARFLARLPGGDQPS